MEEVKMENKIKECNILMMGIGREMSRRDQGE